MTRIGIGSLLLLAAGAAWSGAAHAQSDASTIPAARNVSSPERFIIELRGGPYQPDLGNNPAFDRFFAGDSGPLLGLQISYIGYRVPDIAYVTLGGGFSWVHFSGAALAVNGMGDVTEKTSLTLLPLSAIASIRLDALPRKLGLPFIVAGKVGWQWTHWDTDTGARTDATGWSMGLVYGAQLALDLDSFDHSAARSLDEEWGINHSFLFFEVYRFSPTSSSLPIGGTGWILGLGFNF
jgi:hypothetical protein